MHDRIIKRVIFSKEVAHDHEEVKLNDWKRVT